MRSAGHNGAGKTTLTNILGCEQSPTEGDAFVFGHSVTYDPYAIRRLVGVCKQDDYLWPDLSAKEHLELFAGLRGVKPSEQEAVVQKWLESVDLATVQFQFSAGYSGGMKRRLSVALSTIGDCDFILLDEPTTGMDPVSRRFVWRHIDAIKEGRVVLLTTHAMEEADLLADMVAIVRKGELAAFGSPLELKSEFGSALQFSILVDRSVVDATKQTILKKFSGCEKWVTVDAGDAGNITVNIQKIRQENDEDGVDVTLLSDFVAWLESDESQVDEYGFSNSSLEEVFLKVTDEGDANEQVAGDELDDIDVCCKCCSPGCLRCCLAGPCGCCCCPKPHHGTGEANTGAQDVEANEAAVETNVSDIATFKPVLTVRRQSQAILLHSFIGHWTGKASIANWILFGLFVFVVFMMGFLGAGSYDPIPGLTLPTAFLSMMLLSIITPIYNDREQNLFYLMRSQGLLRRSFLLGTSEFAFGIQLIYGFVLLSLYYATPLFRETTVCGIEASYDDCQHNFGDPPKDYGNSIWFYDGGQYQGETVELYAVRTAGGYAKIIGTIVFLAFTLPGASLASSFLPGNKFGVTCVTFIALVASVAPLIKYFIPLKESELIECSSRIDPNKVCFGGSFTSDDTTEEFLNCVGVQINSYQSLCIPAYAAILPQFGVFQTLAMALMSDIKFTSQPEGYVSEVLMPSMSGTDCSGNICKFPYAQALYGQNLGFLLVGAVILLILGVAIASIVAFPTGKVLQMKNRLARAWGHFQCHRKRNKSGSKEDQKNDDGTELEEVIEEREVVNNIMLPLLKKPDPEEIEAGSDEQGEPVLADHASIPRDDLPPVLMYKLRKVYPSLGGLPPKVALESLDLHVPQGQVLGLLGKNGAGRYR